MALAIRRGRPSLYFLHRLQIGESRKSHRTKGNSLISAASRYKANATDGWDYVSKRLPDGAVEITRIK